MHHQKVNFQTHINISGTISARSIKNYLWTWRKPADFFSDFICILQCYKQR